MNRIKKAWKQYSYVILVAFIIGGLFDLRIAIAAIICMVAPIIVAIFRGRYWCGNLCPRGSFYDHIAIKISKHRKVPKLLRNMAFRLCVFTLMMVVVISGLMKNWGNPYGIGMVFYRLIVVTTLVGVILAMIYHERTWCNFCPMGTMASLITKIRKPKNTMQISTACLSCKACGKVCPMDVKPYEYKESTIAHPDCIQCGRCTKACRFDAIH